VPERDTARDGLQDPRGQAVVEAVGLRQRVEQLQLGVRHRDRHRVEDIRRRIPQPRDPGQHRLPHRRRDVRVTGRDDFADEERVAAGDPVQLGRVQPRGQRADRGRRQRLGPQPQSWPQAAQHCPKWMVPGQLVVPVGQHEQERDRLDPAAEQG
jgi:hypothetical protein